MGKVNLSTLQTRQIVMNKNYQDKEEKTSYERYAISHCTDTTNYDHHVNSPTAFKYKGTNGIIN